MDKEVLCNEKQTIDSYGYLRSGSGRTHPVEILVATFLRYIIELMRIS